MYQSHVQSNEDGRRFVLRTSCKKRSVILSIFRSNSVQAWPLWWSYTNTYTGAPSEFLQWEEVNKMNKAAGTLPTAQCIHNRFMSHFIWILILFYVPLNTGNTLKHAINLVLSSWILIYRSCFWRLNIHLHSCKLLQSMEQEDFPRISNREAHTTWGSVIHADEVQVAPFQPAPPETSSALPKLLHSICVTLEEELKGPEFWSIAGFSALLAVSDHSPIDFAMLTAEWAGGNYAHIFVIHAPIFGDSHKDNRLWNKELKTRHTFPVTSSAMGVVNASRTVEQKAPGWDVKTPAGFTSAPLAGPWKSPEREIHKEQEHVHQIEWPEKSCITNIT